jgi:hypothetical protein
MTLLDMSPTKAGPAKRPGRSTIHLSHLAKIDAFLPPRGGGGPPIAKRSENRAVSQVEIFAS